MKAPPPTRTQDLDALIEQYKAAQGGRVRPNKPGSDLIIFVSFSMPKDTLIALSKEAKEAGAVMVVRGFKDGSLRATKQAALDVNKGHAAWEINPGLFRSFQIKTVPTFVVADSQAESVLDNGCSPQATFSAVSGDISVELALEQLRLHAQSKIADMADKHLKDLYAKRRAASIG
jgi:conjugal transfer pilus assembly protein TrbC